MGNYEKIPARKNKGALQIEGYSGRHPLDIAHGLPMAEPPGLLPQMGERPLPFPEVGPGRHPVQAERRAEHSGEAATGKEGDAQYAVHRQPIRQGGPDDCRIKGRRREQKDKRAQTACHNRYHRSHMGSGRRGGQPG